MFFSRKFILNSVFWVVLKIIKMKKLLLIQICILLCTCIIHAKRIYVDDSNISGIENGLVQHPFNSIEEGIDAAIAGDTIMIAAGNYIPDDSWSGNDHTLLLKAGVKLFGESRDNTIINGMVVDQEVSNLAVTLQNLAFDGFNFNRPSHAGPFDGQNVIRNCATGQIALAFGAGYPVNDTTPGPNYGFDIIDNEIEPEGSIEFKQGGGVSVMNVTGNHCGSIQLKSGGGYTYLIDNNTVQYGIWDKSGANTTTISNNLIINGTITDKSGGNQYGLEDEIIENNTITANEDSPAFIEEDQKAAINLSSRSANIRNNSITCHGHVSGIHSKAGAPLHILNNTISLEEVQSQTPDPEDDVIGIFNYSGWGYVKGNIISGGSYGYFSKAGTSEYANNTIENAYSGFWSMGAEEVHDNTIKHCKGDGMILNGLRGPVYSNQIIDNGGAGIRVLRPNIDLGGGLHNCSGNNTITGNGNFDLYIETNGSQYPFLYACYNTWDHADTLDVLQYDVYDGSDSLGLARVNFTPYAGLSTPEMPDALSVEIFPNPTYGEIYIGSSGISDKLVSVEIADISGKTIPFFYGNTGSKGIEINFSPAPSGIYFCRIVVGNKLIMKKIIKF